MFDPTVCSGAARVKPDCSWWDCIDSMRVFLCTSRCASPICAHPAAAAHKLTQAAGPKGEDPHTPIFPSTHAAGSWGWTHSLHLWATAILCNAQWDFSGAGAMGCCTARGDYRDLCVPPVPPASPTGLQDSPSHLPPHDLPSVSSSLT